MAGIVDDSRMFLELLLLDSNWQLLYVPQQKILLFSLPCFSGHKMRAKMLLLSRKAINSGLVLLDSHSSCYIIMISS